MSVSSLSNSTGPTSHDPVEEEPRRGEAGRGLAGAGGGEENAGEDVEGLRQTHPVLSCRLAVWRSRHARQSWQSQESLVGCTVLLTEVAQVCACARGGPVSANRG